MRNNNVLRKSVLRAFLWGLVVMLPMTAVRAQPATQPANDCVQTITYAVPGAKPDATSKAMIVVPAEYSKPEVLSKHWPVVYLLHGYSDNYETWYKKTQGSDRALELMASKYGIILVMPDGKFGSWYLDAAAELPDSADWQWETAIIKHLMPEIDKRFRTWAAPAGRGIAGLSMGGHGAITLCARHPELFSACGSMSGVLDLRPFKDKYALTKLLGPYDANPQRWLDRSAVGLANKFVGRKVGIMIECGLKDKAFIGGNQEMHRILFKLDVPHDYIERPGGHHWNYWINALPYHLQFMHDRLKPAAASEKIER